MYPGVDSDSTNEYQDNTGGKEGRCVRLTNFHFHSAERHEKSGALTYRIPQGPAQACSGTALPLHISPTRSQYGIGVAVGSVGTKSFNIIQS
jgi:hypothetical protein